MRPALVLVLVGFLSPPTHSEYISGGADVSTLDPHGGGTVGIRVGGKEMGGAVLMGGVAPQVAATPSVQKPALRAATQRTAGGADAQGGDKRVEELGENSGAPKLKYTYDDTNWNDYATCNTGIKQSPIDLVRPYFGAFLKLGMNYKDQEWPEQENDGLVIKVPFKQSDGSSLKIGDKGFTPVEAIFRSPSEHKLDGTSFDMEMQIMHKDTIGNQVALSILMQVSDDIPEDNFYIENVFGHFFTDLPQVGNKRRVESMNLKWILNEEMVSHYVTYHGSLTHPPCTEGVEWFILGRPWLIRKEWLDSYKTVVQPNARPAQTMGTRMLKSF